MTTDRREKKRKHAAEEDQTDEVSGEVPKRSKKAGLGEDGDQNIRTEKKRSKPKRPKTRLDDQPLLPNEEPVHAKTQRSANPSKKAYLSEEIVVDSDSEPEPESRPEKPKTQNQDGDGEAKVRLKPKLKKIVAAEARAAPAPPKKHTKPVDDPDHQDSARKSKKVKPALMAQDTSKPKDTAATAAVSQLFCPQSCHPVIATTSGVRVASNATFLPYTRKVRRGRQADEELVLHSTTHHALDYTAQEDRPLSGGQPLKHYLAAWDPETGSLEVIEAKKMTLRGVVRSKQATDESLLPPESQNINRKADLALSFGTKKARKALEANTLNAISSHKSADGSPVKLNAASQAFMDRIGQVTSGMATQDMLQEAIDGSKPVPPANLGAKEVQDVYNPLDVIGPEILNMVPVTDWYEAATSNEPVQVVSRFVANRLTRVASSPEAVPRLRVLRYLYFIIVYWKHLRPGKFGTRKLPQREELRRVMAPAPDVVVDDVKRRFADGSEVRKFHCDLLATYCCALGMVVDGFDMDTYDLREDLQLKQEAMTMYFKEIGARVKLVSEKTASGKLIARHRAVLRLPLQFPKQRQASAKNRR